MIKDLWKDTLSQEYRGQPLAPPGELDEVSCLMVAERIDLKRFTGNLIALMTQGDPLSSLSPMLFAQSQNFTPTPSMDAVVSPFLRPRGLSVWFLAGFPDVADWMNEHLDRCGTTSDEEADRTVARLMGIQGLSDSADLQREMENSQGHLRVGYCRNLIENYKRETAKPLETAFGRDFSPGNIYVGQEMLDALGEESNATLIASMTTKYYIELERGYASRFADKTTLIATAGIVDALMYLIVHKTVLPEQIVQLAKESAGTPDPFSCFVVRLACLLLTVDCPECSPEVVKGYFAESSVIEAIGRAMRRTFLSYSGDPALSSRVRAFMSESTFSDLRAAAGVAPASFLDKVASRIFRTRGRG